MSKDLEKIDKNLIDLDFDQYEFFKISTVISRSFPIMGFFDSYEIIFLLP